MQISTDTPLIFSWQRKRTSDELRDFIEQRLTALGAQDEMAEFDVAL
jgi:hypothetical protein